MKLKIDMNIEMKIILMVVIVVSFKFDAFIIVSCLLYFQVILLCFIFCLYTFLHQFCIL